jgi:hypothetical protein
MQFEDSDLEPSHRAYRELGVLWAGTAPNQLHSHSRDHPGHDELIEWIRFAGCTPLGCGTASARSER